MLHLVVKRGLEQRAVLEARKAILLQHLKDLILALVKSGERDDSSRHSGLRAGADRGGKVHLERAVYLDVPVKASVVQCYRVVQLDAPILERSEPATEANEGRLAPPASQTRARESRRRQLAGTGNAAARPALHTSLQIVAPATITYKQNSMYF